MPMKIESKSLIESRTRYGVSQSGNCRGGSALAPVYNKFLRTIMQSVSTKIGK